MGALATLAKDSYPLLYFCFWMELAFLACRFESLHFRAEALVALFAFALLFFKARLREAARRSGAAGGFVSAPPFGRPERVSWPSLSVGIVIQNGSNLFDHPPPYFGCAKIGGCETSKLVVG